MSTVNMLEAKSHLSRLVDAVESGAEAEIVIARNGKPRRAAGSHSAACEGQAHRNCQGQVQGARHDRCGQCRHRKNVCGPQAVRLLLDTHIALWAIIDDLRLPATKRAR